MSSKNSKSKQQPNASSSNQPGRSIRKNKSQGHSISSNIPSDFNLPLGWEMQVQFGLGPYMETVGGDEINGDLNLPSFNDQDVMKMFQSKLMKQFQQGKNVQNHRSSSNKNNPLSVKDSEVMAVMMSMFGDMLSKSRSSATKVTIQKESVVKIKRKNSNGNANPDGENEKDVYSHNARTSGSFKLPPPSSDWPPGIKEAAAAAIRSVHGNAWFTGNDGWSDVDVDLEEEDHDDDSIPDLFPFTNETSPKVQENDREYRLRKERELQKNHEASLKAAEELIREEEEAEKAQLEASERSSKAAKKREKKQRKKARERKEAAIKDAEAAIKLREKDISTWKSRIVTACSVGDAKKLESLIANTPFRDGKGLQFDDEIVKELQEVKAPLSFDEEVRETLKWLLVNCIWKTSMEKEKISSGSDARFKLTSYITRTSFPLVFEPGVLSTALDGLSRSVFHNGSFLGDLPFMHAVLDQNTIRKDKDRTQLHWNKLCDDLGWGAIHYAAVGGQSELVDLFLNAGCDVHLKTEPSLTCHTKSQKGCTAKELIECILSNNFLSAIISKDNLIREMIDTKRSDMNQYHDTLKQLVQRLSYVEKHGHKSLNQVMGDINSKSTANIDDSKSHSFAHKEIGKPNDESSFASMLSAMGFGTELIDAALIANTGSRRNIDDIVMWILEQTALSEEGINHSSSKNIDGMDTCASKKMDAAKNKLSIAQLSPVEASKSKTSIAVKQKEKKEGQKEDQRHWNDGERSRQEQSASSMNTSHMKPVVQDGTKKVPVISSELHLNLHQSKAAQQNVVMTHSNFGQFKDVWLPSSNVSEPNVCDIQLGNRLDAARANAMDFVPFVEPSITYSSTQTVQHQSSTQVPIRNMDIGQNWRENDFLTTSEDIPRLQTISAFPPLSESGAQSRLQQYISRSHAEAPAQCNYNAFPSLRDQTVPHSISSHTTTLNEVESTYGTSSRSNFAYPESHVGDDQFDRSIFHSRSGEDSLERNSTNQSWKSFGPSTSGSIW